MSENIQDTAVNLVNYSEEDLNVAGTVTATTPASSVQAKILSSFNKPIIYNVTDTAPNLVVNTGSGLNEAVNITTVGTVTQNQKEVIESATNSGSIVYNE